MSSGNDPAPRSDELLVAGTLRGDPRAFQELARRHFRGAFAIAMSIAANRSDAEDICQDALVSAHEHLRECRQPARFAAWFFQIVRNRARSTRDYEHVRRASSLEEVAEFPLHQRSNEDAAIRADIREGISRAFLRLTEVQSNVVVMHDLEGLKHSEIATSLGISELMSRRHLSDARRVLRGELSDHDPRGSDD